MKKFLCFITLFITLNIFAEVIQTDNIADVQIKYQSYLNNYKPNQILVVTGINNTLIYPENAALQNAGENFKPLIKKLMTQLKKENAQYLNEVVLTQYKHNIVDPRIPGFIKEIIAKATPIVGISATLTGNLNQIPRLEIWLADYLKKYNVDFSESFSGNKDFVFKNFKEYNGTYPTYYNGVISTNGKYSKAQLIVDFILQINFTPKVLIVIDQDVNFINGLEQQLKSYNKNIDFTGFYYTAVSKIKFNEINAQEFVNFWSALIEKVNNVKRKVRSAKSGDEPYAE